MVTTFDPGRMIWNGYTGAAGWMFRQALEGVLGVRLARRGRPVADLAPAGELASSASCAIPLSPLPGAAVSRPQPHEDRAGQPTRARDDGHPMAR